MAASIYPRQLQDYMASYGCPTLAIPLVFQYAQNRITLETSTSTCSIQKKQAAARIFREWRRSSVSTSLLRKDLVVIRTLSHAKFVKFLGVIWSLFLKNRGSANRWKVARRNEVISGLVKLKDMRKKYHEERCIPVCTGVKSDGKLPTCHFLPNVGVPANHVRFNNGSIYLTEEAMYAYGNMPKRVPQLIEEINSLVVDIYKQYDLFSWAYTQDGCYIRASLITDLLLLSGLSPNCIYQQYIIVPPQFRVSGAPEAWRYHVAVLVQLEDETVCIIDPSLEPNRALRTEEWLDRQAVPACPVQIEQFLNCGPISHGVDLKQEAFTFTAASSTRISFPQGGEEISLYEVEDERARSWLARLAAYRADVERLVLGIIAPSPLKN